MKKTPTGMKWFVGVILVASIIGFGIQTWELASSLYPSDATFMTGATVMSLDGFYVVWTLIRMFWHPKRHASGEIAQCMFWVCFGGSCLASFVQMIVFAGMHMHFVVDNWVLWICYGVVSLIMIADVLCLVIFVDMEYWEIVGYTSSQIEPKKN